MVNSTQGFLRKTIEAWETWTVRVNVHVLGDGASSTDSTSAPPCVCARISRDTSPDRR